MVPLYITRNAYEQSSTPVASVCATATSDLDAHSVDDVAIIERSMSAPILVPDTSELEDSVLGTQAMSSSIGSPKLGVPNELPETAKRSQTLYLNRAENTECEQSATEDSPVSEAARKCECFTPPTRARAAPTNIIRGCQYKPKKIVKGSGGTSTAASGECEAAVRAQYYHNKLLATLKILRNNEETVRVQNESLQFAESRIAALTERAAALRSDLNAKGRELKTLREIVDTRADKTDASVTTDLQDAESQTRIVNTLQSNLSVIEELYRECFYEAAKQEDLIEMLRKSCLDVRLMDREKTEQIGRLQNVVHKQKWSLERCQDIAMEVDNLKLEISNFLNNSNNDSGMWEAGRGDASLPDVGDELHDITEQLLQLKYMLTGDCTCGLEEENKRLKDENETMQTQIGDLRQRIMDLEAALLDKENMDVPYQHQLEVKEEELIALRQQVKDLNDSLSEKSTICDTLTRQILQTQVMLSDKTEELKKVQLLCKAHENDVVKLKEDLETTNNIVKESGEIRGEVSRLSSQVRCWREQLCSSERRACKLESELQLAKEHCRQLDTCYRDKCECVHELQTELDEAQRRGERLCGEARRAVSALRQWVRRMRARHAEQEDKIKEQETLINLLQNRLQETPNIEHSINNHACCSKCHCQQEKTSSDASFQCALRAEERHSDTGRLSGSEIASCSSAPVPPKRTSRKKLSLDDDSPRCSRERIRSAGVQRPQRRDAGCSSRDNVHVSLVSLPRELSPSEAVCERVERLHAALCGGRRRWAARTVTTLHGTNRTLTPSH